METKELKEVYRDIAKSLIAWKNCVNTNNKEWEEKHVQRIEELMNELPHGSGLNGEWELEFQKSNDSCLIFYMTYDAMTEYGCYDRIIDFTLRVKPSLAFGVNLHISGNFGQYQDIKEYLYEILQ